MRAFLAIVAVAALASASADARPLRDRAPGARDPRCDPGNPAPNGAGIDACAPFAFNPVPETRAPDPRAASEPLLPLDLPPVRNVLTPRDRP